MSAPLMLSLSPEPGEEDVVLGRSIEVLFDQAIDPSTVSTQTFSLMGPGQTSVVEAGNLIHKSVTAQTGREYVTGSFVFPGPAISDTWVQNQKLAFTPDRSLRPDVTYTVLLVGQGSLLAKVFLQNPAGEALASSIQYKFTTGHLDLSVTPLLSPLPPFDAWEKPSLAVGDILVRPRKSANNDLTQVIELIFPGELDLTSFNLTDIVIAGEPFLNDPDTLVPDGSHSVVSVVTAGGKSKIQIAITWGPDPAPAFVAPAWYSSPGASGPVPTIDDFWWMDPRVM